jgi:CPA2 family monovalent cation:H+ antiporter-2
VSFVARNFLEDMALVLCVAGIATVLCQLLRQSLVVGYLVAGLVVGPHVPGLYANPERVQMVSELGVIMLIFSIGLEFKFRQLVRLAPTAGFVALFQILFMIGIGYAAGRFMGWSPWTSLVAGAMVSISGVVILAKAFEEVKVGARLRELVFGVTLCEDVLAILLLAALITMANGEEPSLLALSTKAGLLGVFIALMIVVGLATVPWLIRKVAHLNRPETLLIVSLGLCFAFATIAERVGYSVALGAFLAGLLIAESGHGADVERMVVPVKQMFGAMFFVSVGMLVDPRMLAANWRVLAVFTSLVIVGKIVSVSLASRLIGERPGTSLQAGFAMAQIGVLFAFLLAGVGKKGTADQGLLYSIAVGASTITAFLSPTLIRASLPAGRWLDHLLAVPAQPPEPEQAGSEAPD